MGPHFFSMHFIIEAEQSVWGAHHIDRALLQSLAEENCQ